MSHLMYTIHNQTVTDQKLVHWLDTYHYMANGYHRQAAENCFDARSEHIIITGVSHEHELLPTEH